MARTADPTAKDSLIAAARAEFARRGLRGARVEDITAACGLSKGAFYLHFETKEGLFKLLVDEFLAGLGSCTKGRFEAVKRFVEEHGALAARDFRERNPKLQQFVELECQEDLRALELMWQFRDVLDVLISGCQGTVFEGTLWQILDAEQARVVENHRQLQGTGCLRADVPPEIFGALIVGTYLLVGKQMARATEKPDLESLARTLQQLIREGSVPRDAHRARASRQVLKRNLPKKPIRNKAVRSQR